MFNFTKDCFVGAVSIDKYRIEYFEILNYALKKDASDSDLEKLKRVIACLEQYSSSGFKEEEDYMTEIVDRELEVQKNEHKWFTDKLQVIKSEVGSVVDETAKAKLDEVIRFMIKWLYSHIVSKDTLISKPVIISEKKASKENIEEESADPFAFTSKYLVGVSIIDDEHKRLFEIIKEANDVMHNDFLYDKFDQISNLLGELVEYTKVHFADEEKYMESINYEGLEDQKRAHSMFVEKIENINLDDVDENQDEYLTGLLNFLLDWLANHILKADKLIPVVELK